MCIAGWLFTLTHDYTVAFVVNGIFLSMTGFVMYTVPCVKQIKEHFCKRKPVTVAVETQVMNGRVSLATKTTITVP